MHPMLLAAVTAAVLFGARDAWPQNTPLSRPPIGVAPEANPRGPAPRPPALGAPADLPRTRLAPPREAPPREVPPPVARRAAPPAAVAPAANTAAFGRDLAAAIEIDAAARGIRGQRDAVRSRDALVRSITPGSPTIGGSWRSDTRGPDRAREWDIELGVPIWLPGQRSALAGTVEAGVAEQDWRFALRRLEVAALLRDAYWAVAAAESELRVARDRLATALDVGRDFDRRVAFGDIAATEALLGRNEELSAQLDLSRAEAAIETSRAAYRTLTGGSAEALSGGPVLLPEVAVPDAAGHPALRAAEATLAAAEARSRLVAATPRDNPELGVFTRRQGGPLTEDGYSLGLRVRIPFATDARNLPRRADAEAERTRAAAELAQAKRLVAGEIGLARVGLVAAEQSRRIATERQAVADRQLSAARGAFRSGEIGAFDLFRVRQLQIEAVAVAARAQVEAGRARSRLNQALGVVPGG